MEVNPDCTLPGHPEIFAIGDMVSLNKLPGVAQPAMQEGTYVGRLILARLAGRGPMMTPFKYFDKGNMATIGHKRAVAEAFGRKVTGLPAYVMWGFIHVLYLIGWGNRLGTMYTWARAMYFTKSRAHRVITFEHRDVSAGVENGPARAHHAPPGTGAGHHPGAAYVNTSAGALSYVRRALRR